MRGHLFLEAFPDIQNSLGGLSSLHSIQCRGPEVRPESETQPHHFLAGHFRHVP